MLNAATAPYQAERVLNLLKIICEVLAIVFPYTKKRQTITDVVTLLLYKTSVSFIGVNGAPCTRGHLQSS